MHETNMFARAGASSCSEAAASTTVASLRLSPSEEAVLRAYFGCYMPSAPGEQSNLHATCARMASAAPLRTIERPTPGTPWTEIIECAGTRGAANVDGEDAMIAYVDARRRFRQVHCALALLPERDRAVLDAYYGAPPTERPLGPLADVACLTETAWRRNRSRAARDVHEPIEATVRWLAAAVAPDARAALEQVRREATELLAGARSRYRLVRQRRA